MKKYTMRVLASAAFSLLAFAAHAGAPVPAALPGHYYLGGVTEVGSELLLKKDGSFQWMLSYGNVDQQASGAWRVAGDEVTLETGIGGKEPTFRLFKESELSIKKPAGDGVWVAIVGYPLEGPMAGVEVKFEAKSGKTATAVSAPSGDAIVKMPASEQWVRAGLRREGAKVDYQWLAIPAARAGKRIAAFAPDDSQWLNSQAFKTLTLRVLEDGLQVSSPDTGLSRGVYKKGAAH
jgi:hypothetical protein